MEDHSDLPPVNGASTPPEPPASGGDGDAGQTEASSPTTLSGDACSVDYPHEGFDDLARAISATLGAVMREFDTKAEGAIWSQDKLALSIDRLTVELDKLLEDVPLLSIMQHAAKISSIRRRVSALNLLLKSIQRRMENIDRMLSTGVLIGSLNRSGCSM